MSVRSKQTVLSPFVFIGVAPKDFIVFIGGVFMLLPNATNSLTDVLEIGAFDALANMLVPRLVVTYLSMLVALVWADSKTLQGVE